MTPPEDSLVGRVIDGRYEILARIGEGGMGVVYKARQIPLDRVIALKMLSPQMAADPTWIQRFYHEAKACSRLQHPNTIRMFDFGQTTDGRLFMTIVHRDIKPDNAFLLDLAGSPDFVKQLDFSVAKLLEGDRMKTQTGVVLGTPQYMSPEQAAACRSTRARTSMRSASSRSRC